MKLGVTSHKVVNQNVYYARLEHILQFKALLQIKTVFIAKQEVLHTRVQMSVSNAETYLTLHPWTNHIAVIYMNVVI